MANTTTINNMELIKGDIVHFYGARFEITSTEIVTHEYVHEPARTVMVAIGKWLDGNIVNGYFGPRANWNFQGNEHATRTIEKRR